MLVIAISGRAVQRWPLLAQGKLAQPTAACAAAVRGNMPIEGCARRLVCTPAFGRRLLGAAVAALGGQGELLAEGGHPLIITKVVGIVRVHLSLRWRGGAWSWWGQFRSSQRDWTARGMKQLPHLADGAWHDEQAAASCCRCHSQAQRRPRSVEC